MYMYSVGRSFSRGTPHRIAHIMSCILNLRLSSHILLLCVKLVSPVVLVEGGTMDMDHLPSLFRRGTVMSTVPLTTHHRIMWVWTQKWVCLGMRRRVQNRSGYWWRKSLHQVESGLHLQRKGLMHLSTGQHCCASPLPT